MERAGEGGDGRGGGGWVERAWVIGRMEEGGGRRERGTRGWTLPRRTLTPTPTRTRTHTSTAAAALGARRVLHLWCLRLVLGTRHLFSACGLLGRGVRLWVSVLVCQRLLLEGIGLQLRGRGGHGVVDGGVALLLCTQFPGGRGPGVGGGA